MNTPADNCTLNPGHELIGPVIIGVGFGFATTATELFAIHPLSLTVSVYVPEVLTVIDEALDPFDHW